MDEIDLLPPWKIAVTTHTGGTLLVARPPVPEPRSPIGFALLTCAFDDPRQPFLYMDMIGVHKQYRNAGVGQSLLQVAWQVAVERGVQSISWTYDPLQGANANLYIRKCGAVGTRFYFNYYGTLTGADHNGPTDRLLVHLNHSPSIQPPTMETRDAQTLSALTTDQTIPKDLSALLHLEVPKDITAIADPKTRETVRHRAGDILNTLLTRYNYSVTGFLQDRPAVNTYILTRPDGITNGRKRSNGT